MVTKKPKQDRSEDIWNKIKSVQLDLFGLPGQTIEKHAKRLDLDTDVVHLEFTTTAALPAFEEALKNVKVGKQRVESTQVGKYTVVSVVEE